MNHAGMAITGSYELRLVALSYLIAVFASYTALDLARQVTDARGRARMAWLIGGAVAMGIGVWSMHFTGMLAFMLPVPVTYDIPIVLVSLLAAVGASGIALFTVSHRIMGARQLIIAGPIMGAGIATMHYTGMAAMRMPATLGYQPALFAASIVVAVAASVAALWIAFQLRGAATPAQRWLKLGSALVMGVAIVGMHYTGMAAAMFTATDMVMSSYSGFDTFTLAVAIGLITLVILGLAIVSALIDRRLAAHVGAFELTKQRYTSLIDYHPDAIYSFDLTGKLLAINPAVEHLTGRCLEDLRDASFAGTVLADDQTLVARRFLRAAGGEPQSYDGTVAHGDGRNIDVSVTCVPMIVADQIVGVYGILKDITERKRAEELAQRGQVEMADVISQQQRLLDTIRALSTPVLPVDDHVLVIPLVGHVDGERSAQIMDVLLAGVERHSAQIVIIDITGVPVVDTAVAQHLLQATRAVGLLGARCVLVGIAPEVAQTIVQLGVPLDTLVTQRDLQAGVAYALKQQKRTLIK